VDSSFFTAYPFLHSEYIQSDRQRFEMTNITTDYHELRGFFGSECPAWG
jgi:hypothetical protein